MFPHTVSAATRKLVSSFTLFTAGYLSKFLRNFPINYRQVFLRVGAFETFRVSCA